MSRNAIQLRIPGINGATTNGFSGMIRVTDWANIILGMDFTGSAAMTVKIAGGIGTKVVCAWQPANSPAANSSANNLWDFVEVMDLQSGTAFDGDLGIQVNGAQSRLFKVNNTSHLDWLAVFVTTRSAGAVTAKVSASNN